jgi:hypothetical protein
MKVIPEENSEDQAFWALDLCAISFSEHLKVPEQKQFGCFKKLCFLAYCFRNTICTYRYWVSYIKS